ncbi:MAG: small subunit ribosomal protein [Actinomycetota bacterium]|jgi:small subunit ribosomal protein S18|nr:small subunit ribosomal protein [Actinomycetota bacterium]
MARKAKATRERAPKGKDAGKKFKKKVCIFCKDKVTFIDYKDVNMLRRFMSDRAKIRARRVSGNCAQHQRDVAVAIKTAREVALLPYTVRVTSSRGGGRDRGDRGDRGGRGERERDLELDTSPPPSSVGVLEREPALDDLPAALDADTDDDAELDPGAADVDGGDDE